MPPKDFQPTGFVFRQVGDDEYVPIGRITDIDIPEIVVLPEYVPEESYLSFKTGGEMSFTSVVIRPSRNLILWLCGLTEEIPNNWLKMHGHPMRRCRNGRNPKRMRYARNSNNRASS